MDLPKERFLNFGNGAYTVPRIVYWPAHLFHNLSHIQNHQNFTYDLLKLFNSGEGIFNFEN
jgi:hypothetical protein